MECQRVLDFNRVCMWCMRTMMESHTEAGRNYPLDDIVLLV